MSDHHRSCLGRMSKLALMVCVWFTAKAEADNRTGTVSMPAASSLLIGYFEEFLQDRDVEQFRARVLARYNEGTLSRLVQSGENPDRRAAVLALGLIGSYESNPVVARALRDKDPVVRQLAQNALWTIWSRADTPENNAELEQIRGLLSEGQANDAIRRSNILIDRSPRFAEAYNQRAIAFYGLKRFQDSAADCRRVLERNPFHIGALGGLAKCYLELGLHDEALTTFRRAYELQPFDDDLKSTIQVLEASGR